MQISPFMEQTAAIHVKRIARDPSERTNFPSFIRIFFFYISSMFAWLSLLFLCLLLFNSLNIYDFFFSSMHFLYLQLNDQVLVTFFQLSIVCL